MTCRVLAVGTVGEIKSFPNHVEFTLKTCLLRERNGADILWSDSHRVIVSGGTKAHEATQFLSDGMMVFVDGWLTYTKSGNAVILIGADGNLSSPTGTFEKPTTMGKPI